MAEQIIIELIADSTQLTPTIDLLEKLGKISASDSAEFKKLAAASAAANKQMVTDASAVAKTMKDVEKSISKLGDVAEKAFSEGMQEALDEAGVSMEEFTKALGGGITQVETKSKSLKAQLREMKEELSRLDDAGESNTDTFMKLSVEAAKLEDQLGDTQARIRALASDTANIDATVQGLQALASGFQVAAGMSALLGGENEDFEKALVKLNAIMAVTNGIQQLQNTLQKETILMQKLGIIQTKGMAAAQKIYAVAVGTSTGAMKAFRIALLASGIGAIVALLVMAADAMGAFGDATEETTEELKAQKEAADELVSSLTEVANLAQRSRAAQDGGLDSMRRQLELLKARGASAKEIHDQEQKIRQEEIGELRTLAYSYQFAYETRKKNGQLTVAEAEVLTNKINEINKEGLDKQNEIEAARVAFQRQMNEKAEQEAEKSAERMRVIREKNAQAAFEMEQRRLERERAISAAFAGDEAMNDNVRIQFLQREHEAVMALLTLQRQKELDAENLTALQITNINDKFRQQELDAIAKFETRRIQLLGESRQKAINERNQFFNEISENEKKNYEKLESDAEKYATAARLNNQLIDNQRFKDIGDQYRKGIISLEEYERRKKEIQQNAAREELQIEISRVQKLIDARKALGEDTNDLEIEMAALRADLYDKDVDRFIEAEEEKTKEFERQAQIRQELLMVALEITQEVSDLMFEVGRQRRQLEFEEQMAFLDQAKARELDNKNLTEQQKADIENKYLQRQKQLKRQAAQAEKQAQVNQALINGALAVGNALATTRPFIPNALIAAGLATVMTAVQVAKIRATPIPQYAKGEVDIQGPGTATSDSIEARISRGESVINAASTAKWKEALEAINSNRFEGYLDNIVQSLLPNVDYNIISDTWVNQKGELYQFDYKKLGHEISKNIPRAGLSVDENGFKAWVQEGNSKITYQNNRFSTS